MLRVHAPEARGRYRCRVRIDGKARGSVYAGEVADFAVAPGSHSVTLGSRFFHTRAYKFEDDGESVTDVTFAFASGWSIFRSSLYGSASANIWRVFGDVSGIGLWAYLMVISTILLYHCISQFHAAPAIWLVGEQDPRVKAHLVRKPLRGYPYSPDQLEPSSRAEYEAEIKLWQRRTEETKLRVRKVPRPLRGYPYHPEQLRAAGD